MNPNKPFIRVMGSADWLPSKDNDGSSYLINDQIMIDTGWSIAYNMINQGLEPLHAPLLCFTHMHADHILGLPQLILYWRIRNASLREWTLAGPKATVSAAFQRAFDYVFDDSEQETRDLIGWPQIIELEEGDAFEAQGFAIRVTSSNHAVTGLCYRFEHMETGRTVGFSGDTAYHERFAAFFRGCDLLVHEASSGAGPVDPVQNAKSLHSSGREAARVAEEAQVKRLVLTHAPVRNREGALNSARKMLSIPVSWAMPHAIIEV